MLGFLHLFPDLQSLKAGIAVKCLHPYLSEMIEKRFCLGQFSKREQNQTLVKEFKEVMPAVILKECCLLILCVLQFDAWSFVDELRLHVKVTLLIKSISLIFIINCSKIFLGPKRPTGPSPFPTSPLLWAVSKFQGFSVCDVWLCAPVITQTQQGLCVQQAKQGGGAQLWLVQLAGLCCSCFVLHSSGLHLLAFLNFSKLNAFSDFFFFYPFLFLIHKQENRFRMNLFDVFSCYDWIQLFYNVESRKIPVLSEVVWNAKSSQLQFNAKYYNENYKTKLNKVKCLT